MPTFHHDGIEFHYQDSRASESESGSANDGRPFVFQHGLGGDVTQPFGLFKPPAGIRLLAFDARGHGQTRPLGDVAKLNFKTFGEDLQALLQHLGLERRRIILGGISMGASLALSFALRHPEQLDALVLSRPAWLEEPCPYNVKMFTLISTLLLHRGAERGLAEFQATAEYQEALARWPDAARSFSLQFQNPRSEETALKLERLICDRPHPERSAWSTIKVPTLVLGNRTDPVHPFEFAEEWCRAIPRAEFCEVTSKSVSVDRHTADVQRALETFLGKLPKPRA